MAKQPPPEGYLFSKAYTHYVFLLLWLLYFFDYIDRMVVVSLFPFLKADWGLTDAQCGAMVSAVYWAIILFSFPISILIDRWSRKKSIGIMAVLWSLATVACAFTRNFGQLFAARAAIGIGEAGYAPGGTAMISALYPEKRRAFMVGIWNASIPLGMAAGIVIGGLIASRWGWRHAFGIVALPGLIIALLFFFVRDYKTVGLEKTVDRREAELGGHLAARCPPNSRKMTKMDIVRTFAATPSLILTYFGFAGMMFTSISMSTFLPTYFERVQGFPLQKATLLASGIMLTAIIGSPLGGWIADTWMKKRMNARLLLPSVSALLTAVLFLTGFHLPTGGMVQYGIFLLAGIASIAWASSAIAVTQDVVHPGLRAVSYALCVITQNLLGSALGPIVTGLFSDRYGILTALKIASAMALVSFVLFYLGSRYYVRDLDKVERVALTAEE
ncbi:MAG: MFS transporter [Proteobacteria bacterium]|nr:MFS transporter [Pseudomonadota bacterium]MBU4582464.1 MFS transporter [Pseudomonadota bacterium]MCG2738879.1 MFS transporter [Syntrophaceae bacterium]